MERNGIIIHRNDLPGCQHIHPQQLFTIIEHIQIGRIGKHGGFCHGHTGIILGIVRIERPQENGESLHRLHMGQFSGAEEFLLQNRTVLLYGKIGPPAG